MGGTRGFNRRGVVRRGSMTSDETCPQLNLERRTKNEIPRKEATKGKKKENNAAWAKRCARHLSESWVKFLNCGVSLNETHHCS